MNVRLFLLWLVFLLPGANAFAGTDLIRINDSAGFYLCQQDAATFSNPGSLDISSDKKADPPQYKILICEDVEEEDDYNASSGKYKAICSFCSKPPFRFWSNPLHDCAPATSYVWQFSPRYIFHRNLRI